MKIVWKQTQWFTFRWGQHIAPESALDLSRFPGRKQGAGLGTYEILNQRWAKYGQQAGSGLQRGFIRLTADLLVPPGPGIVPQWCILLPLGHTVGLGRLRTGLPF